MDLGLFPSNYARLPEVERAAPNGDAHEIKGGAQRQIDFSGRSYPPQSTGSPVRLASRRPALLSELPERIDVRKASASYRAHSYHTKVPPDAIRPFVRAFSRRGELVLDPFCRSGMTGIAALAEGRDALLSDLSPAAVHIARNYISFCDPASLASALSCVEKSIEPTIARLYRPAASDRIVEYTTWSDVYRCPSCQARIVYWELMQRGSLLVY
jgi:DNA methylase